MHFALKLTVVIFLIFICVDVSATWAEGTQSGGSYTASVNRAEQEISFLESRYGQYDLRLATALGHLGALYHDAGQYDLSMDMFRRAQHVTHRCDGVYSLHQRGFIHWITKINIATRRFRDADVQQRFLYHIQEKTYGTENPRLLPAMNQFGRWLKLSGNLNEALTTYRKASELSHYTGVHQLDKLTALRGLSSVLFLKGVCCPDEPLTELLSLVRRTSKYDRVDEIDAMIHLADMKLMRESKNQANAIYENIWEKQFPELFETPVLLGITGIGEAARAFRKLDKPPVEGELIYRSASTTGSSPSKGRKVFKQAEKLIGEPISLCYSQALNITKAGSRQKLADYYIDLDFSVSGGGKVSHISVLASNTPAKLQRYVKIMLSKSRFRPRLINGQVVDTQHVVIHQTFTGRKPVDNKNMFNRQASDSRAATLFGCHLLTEGIRI